MTTTTFSIAETTLLANTPTPTASIAIAAGYQTASIGAQLVSSQWIAAGQPATGTVTLDYQVSYDGGTTWLPFDTTTWPNNLYTHSGGLPGSRYGWGDGLARSLRAVVTTTVRMKLGCTGDVTTTP